MALLHRASPDIEVLALFEESGHNVERAALLLRDLLVDYPERADLARELVLCEHEGDRIAHDIIHRLKGGDGNRAPMDPIDGYQLATALDDIVDFAEQAADNMGLFRVEAPMEQASQMGDVLVGAGEQVARALRSLRTGSDLVALPRRDPPPGERGRSHQPRRRRVAVRQRHRPDGRHPLEGHLRLARGQRRRVRARRPRARGHQPAPARRLAAVSAAAPLGGGLPGGREEVTDAL